MVQPRDEALARMRNAAGRVGCRRHQDQHAAATVELS